ncbi:MAG: ABC transporter ATP-binding protein [Bacillota bacterium]|nr:ABC transporter ATP-binding protein [Bacillota bacterium]
MINATNVVKTFDGFRALDGLSLHIDKGSVYGLIGPNGAGKTTFIKSLMGIYKQDEGIISVDGETVYNNPVSKQRIIYISDELYFFPTYSILDMAKYYAGIYENWSWETFENLKGVFKIDVKRKIRRLSKGMQKQVAFWLGICTSPDVMVLDEPIDGLDPVMRRNTWSLVLQMVADKGTTVLISSHNLRELEDVCDHVGIMHQGKIVMEKALDDVKGNIHKLQLAFDGGMPLELRNSLDIIHEEVFGSVELLIVRGEDSEIAAKVNEYKPLVADILPLSLEEIFIYELGGMGYELESILL